MLWKLDILTLEAKYSRPDSGCRPKFHLAEAVEPPNACTFCTVRGSEVDMRRQVKRLEGLSISEKEQLEQSSLIGWTPRHASGTSRPAGKRKVLEVTSSE